MSLIVIPAIILTTNNAPAFSQGGVLGMFVGQSVGAGNPRMAGVWTQVSFVVISVITVIIMITWSLTGPLIKLLKPDTDPETVSMAGYFAMILALSLPARNLMMQLGQYFAAQGMVRPPAIASVFAAVFNLVFGLIFVLGVGVAGWEGIGFIACPIVTTVTEWVQVALFVLVFCICLKMHKSSWPVEGWVWSEITWARVSEFLRIFLPAALSLSSDFWRMSVVGILAASLGELDLAVFNASYRILWMVLSLVGALGAAVGVRISLGVGAENIPAAKQSIFLGSTLTLGSLAGLSVIIYFFIGQIAHIFSNDPIFISEFVKVRAPLCAFTFFMNLSVYLERIPMSMGKTKEALYAGLIGSWLGQVPGAYIAVTYWRHDLVGLYWGATLGYAMLCALLFGIIISTNWEDVVRDSKSRVQADVEEEEKPLLENL
ncbi:hypothetical protein SARC_01295 [Sphaeroforma arctica JP610]|uniref:MATE efflux family protein n=1 Tax=Sphaeroforma arctica JP610 TaxID=667725 RepID=A0A0L0GC59_9EUKA|nr:hypothetical protein SARC_01295 [Sphaeroforma arctica JP610]KNC86572.1 hypothetical protein SARC_01295 [Sphaeroforma arctica JP610]|eukprot:XP_014160474.1 hypothetical protein SARC_01295 [Sphaeroforma arctica JP610]